MKSFNFLMVVLALFLVVLPSPVFCDDEVENIAEIIDEANIEEVEENSGVVPEEECVTEDMMEEKVQKIKEIEETVADLKRKYEKLQAENSALQKETAKVNEQAKDEMDALKTENVKHKEEIASLTSLVEEKEGKLEKVEGKLEQVSNELEEKTEELTKASKQNKEKAADSAKEKFAEYEEKIAALESAKAKGEKETERLLSKVSELEARVTELKTSGAESEDLGARIEELEKTLKNDVSECRAETSSLHEELKFHRQGVHIVALYRASEHLSAAKDASIKFYAETANPNMQRAYEEMLVLCERLWELYTTHLQPKVAEILKHAEPHTEKARVYYAEKVEPVYKEQVAPHVEAGLQKGSELSSIALEKGKLALEEFRHLYAEFRERGIRTLKRNEAFAPHAGQIFDGCVNSIIGLSCLLLAGPVIRLVLGLIKFIIFLPFRILCCVFCCRCGCGRRRKSVRQDQASPVAPPKKGINNKNARGSKKKQI
mmetsp:Transcript_25659/g.31539  ORF Transcript_25659/g.31539 Transcript_25659/m.31539 type:complete len:488 (+) Transcript_25659:204-1667(+)